MRIHFNFENSVIYPAVSIIHNPFFKLLKVLKWIAFITFLFALIIFVFSYDWLFAGFGLISLAIFLSLWHFIGFVNTKVKNPEVPPNSTNLADFLDFEAGTLIHSAITWSLKYCIYPIDTLALLASLVISKLSSAYFLFSRLNIDRKKVKDLINKTLQQYSFSPQAVYSDKFLECINKAFQIATERHHQKISFGDLVIALVQVEPLFEQILIEFDLQKEDVKAVVEWWEKIQAKLQETKKFWEYKNLIKKGSIAKEWAAGYTITLDEYGIDWTEEVKKMNYPEIIGYKDELAEVERILSNPQMNNVLLVGEAGVGKKNIIIALAEKSVLGLSLPEVNYKRVVELKMSTLLAKAQSLDEAEVTLETIFKEVIKAGNVILVIDEFHNYVQRTTTLAAGAIDISGILVPFLKYPQFPIIAITTYAGLHKNIEQNPSLLSHFNKVEVKEPSLEDTLLMLQQEIPWLEKKYKVFITYPALKELVELSEKYITAIPFPKKAKDLLEELVVEVSSKRKKIVLPDDVDELITKKTEIPVGKLEKEEKQILLNLEQLIHRRIINQDEAVKEVASALRRARAEITYRKKPMGSFLFLGPTGVGKTETAKALAEIYFGSEERMIRLDMSEFQNPEDIYRLIGGEGEEGLLTTPVRENPFSLLLLDEIEKAHPNILNLFLQVLDEAHITDGIGRKVDFRNTIIIATSNAGYKLILDALKRGESLSQLKPKLLDYLFQQGTFRPEFINRFDAVVLFRSLSKENLLDIVQLMLDKVKKGLEEKNIEFIITPELKEKIVELGYSITFGARNLRRVIQDKVEDVLAKALLSGKIKKGDKIYIDPTNFEVKVVK